MLAPPGSSASTNSSTQSTTLSSASGESSTGGDATAHRAPPGATSDFQFRGAALGSKQRSLQSKLQDIVNVRDFGAVCDGSIEHADADTAGIIAAIASVKSGGEIDFPAGRCMVRPMQFSGINNVRLIGKGRQASLLTLTTSGTAITFSDAQWLTISHLAFDTLGKPQALPQSNGLRLDSGSNNALLDDISVIGFSGNGLQCFGTRERQISGIRIAHSYFLGNRRSNAAFNYCNDFSIEGNQFGMLEGYAHADFGFLAIHSSAGTYNGNYHWQNVVGFRQEDSSDNRILGNRFELSDRQGVDIVGGSELTFEGNDIHTNSQEGNGRYDDAVFSSVTDALILGNKVYHWDASQARWGINLDGDSRNVSLGKNKVFAHGFSPAYGPYRIDTDAVDVSGDLDLTGTSGAPVAPGGTVFLGPNGAHQTEADAYYVIPRRAMIMTIYAATEQATSKPATFVYTLRKNGAPTAMTVGSKRGTTYSVKTNSSQPAVLVAPGDVIDIQLTSSADAPATRHRWYISLLEY
ncbi:right-handed parallel beta-helix repeat-containing protein [Burkholderia gladioli]|uniref:right-handed parallel beta-helix repeat-containing protein n=1 Tax=Burkholderia gladioli TaxID=28095 RepID=UPI0015610EC0|nr:right-handed parallel beta-helix repeat-containing protein [Burkholderia gladioli]MDN7718701.1 NosD domain-containing protein [Burkholderia gladioli]NRF84766.1 right-handed parallel beta-helix repeat-containing protein [Burkholderia gladioli]